MFISICVEGRGVAQETGTGAGAGLVVTGVGVGLAPLLVMRSVGVGLAPLLVTRSVGVGPGAGKPPLYRAEQRGQGKWIRGFSGVTYHQV